MKNEFFHFHFLFIAQKDSFDNPKHLCKLSVSAHLSAHRSDDAGFEDLLEFQAFTRRKYCLTNKHVRTALQRLKHVSHLSCFYYISHKLLWACESP